MATTNDDGDDDDGDEDLMYYAVPIYTGMYEGVYGVYVFLRFHSRGRRREINWISEPCAIQIARISLAPSHLRVPYFHDIKGDARTVALRYNLRQPKEPSR